MNRIALFLIALAAFCSAAHANVIVNGDFESSSLFGWNTYTIANGRLSQNPATDPISFVPFDANSDGLSSTAARFRVGQVTPYVANQWAGGGISQLFVAGAGAFSLDLDVATFFDPAASGLSAQGGRYQIFLDNLLVGSYDSLGIARGATKTKHISYAGTFNDGLHELKIEMTRQFLIGFSSPQTITPFQFLDDIVLNASSVPEPGTTSVVCAGIAMLGFMRRKARRS